MRLNGHACLGDFHQGHYECDYVSPWTKSAANADSRVMLIAQDWASAGYLGGPVRQFLKTLGYDPNLPTNVRLQALLGRHLAMSFSDAYATNLFPFVKLGNMSAPIPTRDLFFVPRSFACLR